MTKSLQNKSQQELAKIAEALKALDDKRRYNFIDFVFPDTGPYSRDKYKIHIDFINKGASHRMRAFIGANRPLSEETLVCMANGTKKELKDIVIGDQVLGLNLNTLIAQPCKVIDIPYVGIEDCYKITTNRNHTVEATLDHEFPVFTRSGSSNYKKFMAINDIKTNVPGSCKKGLITPKNINYKNNNKFKIHPYTLGVLLGDGSFKFNTITITTKDTCVLDKICIVSRWTIKHSNKYTYTIVQGNKRNIKGQFTTGHIRSYLNDLELYNKTHIPLIYKTASFNDRLELLAGLIDTDGTNQEFVNKSKQLVKDFCDVVISVGGYASYKKCKKRCVNNNKWGIYYRAYYRLPFKLPLTLHYKQPQITKRICNYNRNPINKIEYSGRKKVRCITIDHPDHTFLVNDYIATSNSGKTMTGLYEVVMHCTGKYPSWWKGKRFNHPVTFWLITESGQLFRDSMQEALLGKPGDFGTGLIPKELLIKGKNELNITALPGIPGGVGAMGIKHISGGWSRIVVKTYEMRREQFQAAKIDGAMLDEECPEDIFTEVLTRTMGTGKDPGILLLQFTPLKGLTNVVLRFLPNGVLPPGGVDPNNPEKYVCQVTWADIPHLTEADKKAMLAEYHPNERDARSKGIPALGSGRIYPMLEEDIVVAPFKIPDYWPRAYGLDFGWHKTAAIWGAKDPHTNILYLYAEYYAGKRAPYLHAQVIKSRGVWIPGIADPSGGGRSANDGELLIDQYRRLGLDLIEGENAIIAGIARNLNMMESGQLKVFSTCTNFLNEFRVYRYDTTDPNKPAKNQEDHLMDAMKYLTSQFEYTAITEEDDNKYTDYEEKSSGRDNLTGY